MSSLSVCSTRQVARCSSLQDSPDQNRIYVCVLQSINFVLVIAAARNWYTYISGVHIMTIMFNAGLYWSGITICCGNVNETMHELSEIDPSYLPTEQRPDKMLK
ncbi:hypothetical protein BDR04DRAFT_766541 [Suillus decipiens]|nr:hypothetical protein BDR04DRAFT_766541 [Suillus decipiens]